MYFFCLQADRPLTGGLISRGGGLLSRGGACNRLYVFCLPVDGPITGGAGL